MADQRSKEVTEITLLKIQLEQIQDQLINQDDELKNEFMKIRKDKNEKKIRSKIANVIKFK